MRPSLLFRPFRASSRRGHVYTGRRCALPWADMFGPRRGEKRIMRSGFHGFRPPAADSTRGYSPSPHPGRKTGAVGAEGPRGRGTEGLRS